MCRITRAVLLILLLQLIACNNQPQPDSTTPVAGFGPQNLGVIVNDADPESIKIAEYYLEKRHIPEENLIHIDFQPGERVMRPEVFRILKAAVDAAAPKQVQAYALTWTLPFRVGCMSITTAFAAGFSDAFCVQGCKLTKKSPYFDSDSRRPFDDFGWRPAIMLAGESPEEVQALIDRGIASDHTNPQGTGYLVSTTDRARNARARYYQGILLMQSDRFKLELVRHNILKHRNDVMFYFTGLAKVQDIASNHFLPGAIADHLTSAGGVLSGSQQTNSLQWLQAGATGSYGSVVEPCSFVEKFPRPNILINRYLNGETLLESYWKSVEMPGQGVFIGEPLATPFSSHLD
ncbi:MAG: TIGR03790 family protein [Gammaproteobacteria bacterium]